jgi:WD40 repeat protein
VKVYTAADAKMVGTIAAGGPVVDLAFHPTNPVLVGVTKANAATAWNVAVTAGQPTPPEFGRVVQVYAHPAAVGSVAFTGEGFFLTAAADKQVRRFRIASDNPVKTLQHPQLVDAVAFDQTGNTLATGCHDGNLRVWDVAKGQATKTVAAHIQAMPQQAHPVYGVAWAPGDKQIATSSYDHSLKLWDAAGGTLVREFKAAPPPPTTDKPAPPPGPVGHRDQVFALAFSKDGKLLASGSSDRTAKLWDVNSGKVVRDFANPDLKPVVPGEPAVSHPGPVTGVRFSPDGAILYTAGGAPRYHGYLAAWGVADGKRVAGAERASGPIHALAVLPDGRLVLGCGPKTRLETDADALILKPPGK